MTTNSADEARAPVIQADREAWLIDLLHYAIQFHVWADATREEVAEVVDRLSDSDEYDSNVAALVQMPKWCSPSEAQGAVDAHFARNRHPHASAVGMPSREDVRQSIINAPETADFMAGVPLEAAHQRERWGSSHDAGKSPFDWFWLIGYLAQKAADAAARGDAEKAKHHTISTAAALANWHAALAGIADMRAGIGPGNGGEKPGSAFDLASKLAPPGVLSAAPSSDGERG